MIASFRVIQISKRDNESGGIIPIVEGGDCDICEGIKNGKYITHVVSLGAEVNGKFHPVVEACKSCLCDAIAALDKRILED